MQAKLLEQVLRTHGFSVFIARNGIEALDVILSHDPALVISDILMPEMDGFELCRQIRRNEAGSHLPVVLLTQLNDPGDVINSLEAGADYFISKPYNNGLLLSRISAILQRNGTSYKKERSEEITFKYQGQDYSISAPKKQIIDLLLATYELAAEKNQELLSAKQELRELNQDLEMHVLERTVALEAETAKRARAMEELRKKDEILMQQSRQAALGEMIGNIAHQWRQPLNAVGLLVQDIALSYEYDNFSKAYLDSSTNMIMNQVRHMSQVIDDFRNFFTPQKGKVDFDLGETVAKSLALVEGSLSDKGIRAETSIQSAMILTGFPNEFSQVLLNILNNTKDAFSGLTVEDPFVSIRVCAENDKAVVTIADNAGGIPQEFIDRIFEPYFTTKEQGKWTGIGLYLSKNIVEKNMNGSLTVRNTGLGAEFRIEV